MDSSTKEFGDVAQKLARNPLGIIALFIVLVYGFAALVTAFSGSLSSSERLPLIYFLVGFPVLVLGVFAWLVSRHSSKLFSPSDFRNEENYVRTVEVATSLAVASVDRGSGADARPADLDIKQLVRSVREAGTVHAHQRNQVLWVDDRPDNNIYERRSFEAVGISFTLAQSTGEAMEMISTRTFGAIISDMGRREGPREGYVLLDQLRRSGDQTPFFIYAGSDDPKHLAEALSRGAQGSTNNAQKLFQMVMRSIVGAGRDHALRARTEN